MSKVYDPGSEFRRSSPYGDRIDPITGQPGKFHSGQDFAAKKGTAIPAAEAGVVVYSGYNANLGNTVIVQNDTGGYSLYGHMQDSKEGAPFAQFGQRVSQGAPVGYVGSTGYRTTGNHLHYTEIKSEVGPQIRHTNEGGKLGFSLNKATTIDPAVRNSGQSTSDQAASTMSSESKTPDFASQPIPFIFRPVGSLAVPDASSFLNPAPMDHPAIGPFSTADRPAPRSIPAKPLYESGSLFAPLNGSDTGDRPVSFDDRFGHCPAPPAGAPGEPNSPLLRWLREHGGSSLPEAPASPTSNRTDAMPLLQPSTAYALGGNAIGNVSALNAPRAFEGLAAGESPAAPLQGLARLLAEHLSMSAASPTEQLSANPTAPDPAENNGSGADTSEPSPALVPDSHPFLAKIIGDKVISMIDTMAPTVPFAPAGDTLAAGRPARFSNRFGNWAAPGAGAMQPMPPAQSGEMSGLFNATPSKNRLPIFDFPDRPVSSGDADDPYVGSSNARRTGVPSLDDYIRYLSEVYRN